MPRRSPSGLFLTLSRTKRPFARLTLQNLEERWNPAGFELLKDINTTPVNQYLKNPAEYVTFGGELYFTAATPTTGTELWKTDGTDAGTVLVKDLIPGLGSSSPKDLTAVNGSLYFTIADGTELWKSDGTAAGTTRILINEPALSSISQLTHINGSLYFTAYDPIHGEELWKSNGTTEGTRLVKDINPGDLDSAITNLINYNDTLFFTADDGINGKTLWKSDGTDSGTALVNSILANSSPDELTIANGLLYFSATDTTHGWELWKSDGTETGTVIVRDIRPGNSSAAPFRLAAVGQTLYFTAQDDLHGRELWKTDGTEVGTVLVKDITPGVESTSSLDVPTSSNGLLYFTLLDSNGRSLWKSNGTEAGTILVKSGFSGSTNAPRNLIDINGTLYFSASTQYSGGSYLWMSNGTTAGTVQIKEITPKEGSLTNFQNTLYFSGGPYLQDSTVWKSNGTSAGTTQLIANTLGTDSAGISSGIQVDDHLYFLGNDGIYGTELWITDGTETGTKLLKDIYPGLDSSWIQNWIHINGTLFFTADDGVHGRELWKSDGTPEGTVLLKDTRPGSALTSIGNLVNLNEKLLFVTNDVVHGIELWTSDGTPEGTNLFVDIIPGNTSSFARNLTVVDGVLYFTTITYGYTGYELWKSDGTTAGTTLVKAGFASELTKLTGSDGKLYFITDDGVHGYELWTSDGTEAGTILVKDIDPAGSSVPDQLTDIDGTLYFIATISDSIKELWKSDGTEEGTLLVKSFGSGYQFAGLVNLNGLLFFATERNYSVDLWRSDGTEEETSIFKNLGQDPIEGFATDYAIRNGKLYFTNRDEVYGEELWTTDGTLAGTERVTDIAPGSNGSAASLIGILEGRPIVSAISDQYGRELFIGPEPPAPEDIALSNTTFAENLPAETAVAALSSTGPEGSYSYELVDGVGSDDNDLFFLDGNTLKTVASFDFESRSSFTIRIRSLLAGGESLDKAFTIQVTNINEAPTDIALSSTSIVENVPSGTGIGLLSAIDPDAGDTFSYELISGIGSDDNSHFTLNGNTLRTGEIFDAETRSTYSIRVKATDAAGLSIEKSFTITIDNVNEAPTLDEARTVVFPAVARNAANPAGLSVASLLTPTSDEESPESLSVALTGSGGLMGIWQRATSAAGPWTTIVPSAIVPVILARTEFVRFLPGKGITGYAYLKFKAWDGALSSEATETAWVPVGVAGPKYDAQGQVILKKTTEDNLAPPASSASTGIGFLATEFAAKTKLGLAITATTGNGVWQVKVGNKWVALGTVSESAVRLLKPTDSIRFVPAANWNGDATITYRAWKVPTGTVPTIGDIAANPSNFSQQSLSAVVTVAPVNDAPTLDISLPRIFSADAKSVGDLIAGSADIDSTVKGIAITSLASKGGAWEYRTSPAGAWKKIAGVSATSALLLDTQAEIRFTPTTGALKANGSFRYVIWDGSNGVVSGSRKVSTTNAFSKQSETATFSLGNQTPSFKAGADPKFPDRNITAKPANLSLSSLTNRMIDADKGFAKGVAITGLTGNGVWEFSLNAGKTWQSIGDVGTDSLLLRNTDLIRFTPALGSTPGTVTLTYKAWDRTAGSVGDRLSDLSDAISSEELTASLLLK